MRGDQARPLTGRERFTRKLRKNRQAVGLLAMAAAGCGGRPDDDNALQSPKNVPQIGVKGTVEELWLCQECAAEHGYLGAQVEGRLELEREHQERGEREGEGGNVERRGGCREEQA